MATRRRTSRGQFAKKANKRKYTVHSNVLYDHNYACDSKVFESEDFKPKLHGLMSNDSWKEGRRIVEFDVLLSSLKFCEKCLLGPVPLSYYNLIGEMKKGLGGYLYVQCQNPDCSHINRVPYGKTYRQKEKGIPRFAVNTKLGLGIIGRCTSVQDKAIISCESKILFTPSAMVDSLGGTCKVNNFLATLNIPTINSKSLKCMERRAGNRIEEVAKRSLETAAQEAFAREMEDIRHLESQQAEQQMEGLIEDLGVCPLPDASPDVKSKLKITQTLDDSDWTDIEENIQDNTLEVRRNHKASKKRKIVNLDHHVAKRTRLSPRFPCKTRTGMSCAVDTAWHKRGFDSLTAHTFFMSKAKYGKKVLKAVVSHRTCGTCKWWERKRPGQAVRQHRCVKTHSGSARSMESVSGEKGVKQMSESGTPIEYIEGDGDNTLIARLKKVHNMKMKKRFDTNHVVKNIGKSLYSLRSQKGIKLSISIITHIQKCLKYAFAKNQGDASGMEENLKALIPHQFGDHSFCKARFCGYLRTASSNGQYTHRSLPYHLPLKDENLRTSLENIFAPLVANSEQYADLGSSQQCEHGNREVTLRAPKSLHYGNSESIDHRVQATAAFINEGRHYIVQANEEEGLSPGFHTVKYAEECAEHRAKERERRALPSTKRRRLILKQERATMQGAQEALEGATYHSGIGHDSNADIEKLPDAVPKGDFKPVALEGSSKPTFITVDLETTDLIHDGIMPDITQISAMNIHSGDLFDQYVIPQQQISTNAQQVTGIVWNGSTMTVNGSSVDPIPVGQALQLFCDWLKKWDNVFLIAHNGRRFDFPVLMSAFMSSNEVPHFQSCVRGFIDSIPLFKKVFPNQPSYKQEYLVTSLLKTSYNAHNAVEDVISLKKLVVFCDIQSCEIVKFSFSPKALYNSLLFNCEKSKNIGSLGILISRGICKRPTAENIAGSGLNLLHLRKIYERSGEDGLSNTFTSKNSDNQPRVTSAKRILEVVIPKLAEFFKE